MTIAFSGGCDIEPDHVGGLGRETRIVALTPGLAPGKVDLLDTQKTPDLLLVHIAQFGCNQRSRPACKSGRRWPLQYRQNTPPRLGAVLRCRTGAWLVANPAKGGNPPFSSHILPADRPVVYGGPERGARAVQT
jgi:hypothetical protein